MKTLNYFLGFISLLLIDLITSQESSKNVSEIFDKLPAIVIDKKEQVSHFLNNTDQTLFLFYYRRNSFLSIKAAEILETIGKRLIVLAKILSIDCDQGEYSKEKICEDSHPHIDTFPRMKILTPPEFRINPYTGEKEKWREYNFKEKSFNETSLFNFIAENIISRSIKLTSDTIDTFLSDERMNKVILFTDKKKTPLLYRGVSNFFFDRIKFGEVDISETKLMRRFNVMNFPAIIIFQTHEENTLLHKPVIHRYNGKVEAGEVARFIHPFTLREAFYRTLNQVKENPNFIKDNLDEVEVSETTYEWRFKQYSNRNLLVLFHGKNYTNEHIDSLVKETKFFFLI